MNHEKFMRAALQEAQKSVQEGNAPFGAVIVSPNGRIVSRGRDKVTGTGDPTAHAEINAIRKLCTKTKSRDYSGYYCYSTSEPCPMCLGACLKAGINNYVYGAPMEKNASLKISASYVLGKFRKFRTNIIGGILRKECIGQRAYGSGYT